MRHLVLESTDWRRELIRYGASALVVVALLALAAVASVALWRGGTESQAASEVDEAVLVDLPPAAASTTSAPDGPPQAARPAGVGASAPPTPSGRPVPERPRDKEPTSEAPVTPTMPTPDAVLPTSHKAATPSPTAATPTSAPRDERAPDGADVPTIANAESGDVGRPHASARAITAWQKALLKRLETAKRGLAATRGTGTVEIAFQIDAVGALLSERVVTSSGSSRLDAIATTLVRLASPFPTPPKNAAPEDRSFKIPIRFRR